jgi:hypothetical protein
MGSVAQSLLEHCEAQFKAAHRIVELIEHRDGLYNNDNVVDFKTQVDRLVKTA